VGQDDSCGICGKSDCWHLSRWKEHIATLEGKALCRRGLKNPILNSPDTSVDPDIICGRCKKKFKKLYGLSIEDYHLRPLPSAVRHISP
jgi:hypothetical protein